MKRIFSLVALCAAPLGCGPAAPTAVTPSTVTPPAPPPPAPAASAAPPAGPLLAIVLRPQREPTPIVHVEVDLTVPEGAFPSWRILRTPADRVTHAAGRDAKGDIAVATAAKGPGVELTFARTTSGPVHLAYDVLANADAPDDPFGQLVLDDRFRGAGEGLIALPEIVDDVSLPTTVRIDGAALRASNAASSLGVGATRRTTARPRALRYATFLAGSLGAAVFDDPASGRDEAAWLGYTAFDPRPAVAELAQVRTAMRELFKSHDDAPWTYLLMSQTRPIGSFSTTARAASVLVQVGPSEPWSAALRLSITQQLAHRWISGELRLAAPAGHEAEAWWFNDGVARYVAMRVLSRLGLFTANDAREAIAGELAVLATSPYAKHGNAELATMAAAHDEARAVLVARGALYATREAAVIRARTKGARGLDEALLAMLEQGRHEGQHALPVAAWIDAVAKDDPEAARSFDALIVRGGPMDLPATALGPCFHAQAGEYTAFDPGFDVVATSESKDGRIVGLRADGPAAKAGLREGDVVDAMTEREGDADVPVKIAATRNGSKVTVSYAPRGAHGRGQTWSRVRTVADDRCGEMP